MKRCVPVVTALLVASAVQAAPAPTSSTTPRFTAYQRLLDRSIRAVSQRGAPIATRVDYVQLARQGRPWIVAAENELLSVAPSRMSPRARLAWAIDTYNFLVIRQVVAGTIAGPRGAYLPVTVKDLGGFFERPVAQIEGQSYSLDAFERTFVFAGFDRKTANPPAGLDSRAHFALVCGARGCPALLLRAYSPDSLDAQLDFAVRNALASPSHLRIDPKTDALEASSIFEWYANDFGGAAKVWDFLVRYAPRAMQSSLARIRPRGIPRSIPWDWALNAPERRAG
jgi:hypothetical protein